MRSFSLGILRRLHESLASGAKTEPTLKKAEGKRQVTHGHTGLTGRGINHHAELVVFPITRFNQTRLGTKCGLQVRLAKAQAKRLRGRAGATPEERWINGMAQSHLELTQPGTVIALQPGEKDGIAQIVAMRNIRGWRGFPFLPIPLDLLRQRILCRMKIIEQVALTVNTHAKTETSEASKALLIVSMEAKGGGHETEDAALGGLAVGLARLELGVRAPTLERRSQTQEECCHHFAPKRSFTSASNLSSTCASVPSSSEALPTESIATGIST